MDELSTNSYLYGASIQGIQEFIFQTNKLQEIAGGSELVEQICTNSFRKFEDIEGIPIIRAAGNIKHVFKSDKACRRAVLEFPKQVMIMAPGITVSQAVVMIKDETKLEGALNELEAKLKIQRNIPIRSSSLGLIATKRSQRTGMPATDTINGHNTDSSCQKKINTAREISTKLCEKAFGKTVKEFPFNIDKIGTEKSWIAIIHIDGNSLGTIIPQIAHGIDAAKNLSEFSEKLERATINATRDAYKEVEQYFKNEKTTPLRPVILGGDDITIICRADIAIKFTQIILERFESYTNEYLSGFSKTIKKRELLENGLTACAGIAYIKKSYPFHYGYNLAEELCKEAKKDSERRSSCIMFHKVQDSFVVNYNEIVNRELSINDSPVFKYGPYYLRSNSEENWTIEKLLTFSTRITELAQTDKVSGRGIISGLRNIISDLYNDPEIAKQKMERLISNISNDNTDIKKILHCYKDLTKKNPFYDSLSIISVQTNL